jgi:hypothetical protein
MPISIACPISESRLYTWPATAWALTRRSSSSETPSLWMRVISARSAASTSATVLPSAGAPSTMNSDSPRAEPS